MTEKRNRDRKVGNPGRTKSDRDLSGSKQNTSNPKSSSLAEDMNDMDENPRKGRTSEKRGLESRDDSGTDEAN